MQVCQCLRECLLWSKFFGKPHRGVNLPKLEQMYPTFLQVGVVREVLLRARQPLVLVGQAVSQAALQAVYFVTFLDEVEALLAERQLLWVFGTNLCLSASSYLDQEVILSHDSPFDSAWLTTNTSHKGEA